MAVTEYIPQRTKDALFYASLNLPVIPLYGITEKDGLRFCTCLQRENCHSPGKHPSTEHGLTDASIDADTIKTWFQSGVKNIGLRTGSGYFVIDIDPKNGGLETLESWERLHGKLEAGWICKTGSGGFHYYYKGTLPNSQGKLAPGIDTRGDGGYVVAPPSQHVSGEKYVWHSKHKPGLTELSEPPIWLQALIAETFGTPEKQEKLNRSEIESGVSEGSRDDKLYRLACSFRADGVEYDIAEARIVIAAAQCRPPFPEREAIAKVKAVYNKYDPGKPTTIIEVRSDTEQKSFPLTDLGNAERLLFRLDESVRWCHAYSKWLVWDGTIWKVDETGGAVMVQEAAKMVRELKTKGDNAYEKKVCDSWALKCESAARIGSMIDLAKSFAPVTPEELDKNSMLMGVANGTLDLRIQKLKPSKKEDYITKSSPVHFDPKAECPTFERFFGWATAESDEIGDYLQAAFGYTLTGLTTEQCLFFAHGSGANGKSTLLDCLKHILGDYAVSIPTEELMAGSGANSFESTLARMKGARGVFGSETSNKHINESVVKEITAAETMQARMKYGHPFEFQPVCKLWIMGNHKPRITGTDWGIWRRIRLLPFEQKIADEDKDVTLPLKLRRESSGILNFALIGLGRFLNDLQGRLPSCQEVLASTAEYREEMDVLGAFLDEVCQLSDTSTVPIGKLYNYYTQWAKASGQGQLSQTALTLRLKERGIQTTRTLSTRYYTGIGVTWEAESGEAWWIRK